MCATSLTEADSDNTVFTCRLHRPLKIASGATLTTKAGLLICFVPINSPSSQDILAALLSFL
jgi:hypothetical protein